MKPQQLPTPNVNYYTHHEFSEQVPIAAHRPPPTQQPNQSHVFLAIVYNMQGTSFHSVSILSFNADHLTRKPEQQRYDPNFEYYLRLIQKMPIAQARRTAIVIPSTYNIKTITDNLYVRGYLKDNNSIDNTLVLQMAEDKTVTPQINTLYMDRFANVSFGYTETSPQNSEFSARHRQGIDPKLLGG